MMAKTSSSNKVMMEANKLRNMWLPVLTLNLKEEKNWGNEDLSRKM